jgi:hypothetical protein
MLFCGNIIEWSGTVVDTIPIFDNADVSLVKIVVPAPANWTHERHFGMSFDEQQEVIYNTLVAFQEPD